MKQHILILWILILLITSCKKESHENSTDQKHEIKEQNDKFDSLNINKQKNKIDPISIAENYLTNKWFKDSTKFKYNWNEIEEWDALSFKYIVRFEKVFSQFETNKSDTLFGRLTIDSLGEIKTILVAKDTSSIYEYYDSLGVPKGFYSSRKFERIGIDHDIEMLYIDEEGNLTVVALLPDPKTYKNRRFFEFIAKAIPNSDSLDFINVKKVDWSNDIYEGDELEFEVENGKIKNLKTEP